jgi:hypothetical protein
VYKGVRGRKGWDGNNKKVMTICGWIIRDDGEGCSVFLCLRKRMGDVWDVRMIKWYV